LAFNKRRHCAFGFGTLPKYLVAREEANSLSAGTPY
jgi:hypothetical protein